MINTFVAILVELDLIAADEAEALCEKIKQATLPADYKSAARQVKDFLKDIRAGK